MELSGFRSEHSNKERVLEKEKEVLIGFMGQGEEAFKMAGLELRNLEELWWHSKNQCSMEEKRMDYQEIGSRAFLSASKQTQGAIKKSEGVSMGGVALAVFQRPEINWRKRSKMAHTKGLVLHYSCVSLPKGGCRL